MSVLEIILVVVVLLWLMICTLTAAVKGRGMGWGITAWLLPPLYLVLVRSRARPGAKPERARCPLCKLGWVPLDRLPRVCSGCGQEISLAVLQKETHKDMM